MTDTTLTAPPAARPQPTTSAAPDAPAQAAMPANAKPYTGPERRSSMRLWQESVNKRLEEGDDAMKGLRKDLDENTSATKRVEANTQALVDLLNNAQGAFRVLEMLAKLAKPLGAIAMATAAFVGLWSSLKGGGGGKL